MGRFFYPMCLILLALGCRDKPAASDVEPQIPTEVLDKLQPDSGGEIEIDVQTLEHLKLLTGEIGDADFPSTRDVITRCEAGEASACVSVGTRLMHGTWGLKKDQAAAVSLFQHGCDAREMEGCHALAVAIKYGRGVTQDQARSVELFKLACESEHVVACSFYGDAYRFGHGVERDLPRAVEIYERTCLMGAFCRDVAMHRRTLLQETREALFGEGVSAEDACTAGDSTGCWHQALDLSSEPDSDATYTQIERLLSTACETDQGSACDSLGFHYLRRQSSPGYAAKASAAFQRACHLGEDCEHAKACPTDDPTRVQALARGVLQAEEDCDNGQMSRCLSFAISLKTGNGIERDRDRAADLFDRVCHSGDPYGCWYLGGAYKLGQGVPQDHDRAATLYREACDADHANGCVDLAFAHVHGRGVPQDLPTAITFFDKACTLGTACDHADHYRTQLPASP